MENKLITFLRSATGQIHKELETLPVSKIIMSSELTTAAYIHYLHKVYAIHYAIEKKAFPVLAAQVPDLESRKKTEYIINDLTALQASIPEGDTFFDAEFRNNSPFCIGMLYVSEGSTLGGQYILKNVQKVLGEDVALATTFLNIYGPRTGSMWKAFTEMLGTYGGALTETEMQEVAAGAVYGFQRTGVIFKEQI